MKSFKWYNLDSAAYPRASLMTPDSLSYVARIKRFHETWLMDDRLRESLAKDGDHSLARELNINAKDVISLLRLDQERPTPSQGLINFSHFWGEFRSARRSTLSDKGMPEQTAGRTAFQYWRQEKFNLFADETGLHQSQIYPHAPYAIELSSGCSVGCWFCGLDAPGLLDNYKPNAENLLLWKSVLRGLHDVLGDAAKRGFCYWATDPFDNPDYESFIDCFYDEFSCYPKTTTAKALDDVKRTRSWLTKTFNNGLTLNRISVLSLPALTRLHREFSPEDLLCVNLLPRNTSSPTPLVNAGRIYRDPKVQERLVSSSGHATSACVTGFLINMLKKTIRLIAPCPACDQWPNGYRIYSETTFHNPDDIRPALLSLISEATQ